MAKARRDAASFASMKNWILTYEKGCPTHPHEAAPTLHPDRTGCPIAAPGMNRPGLQGPHSLIIALAGSRRALVELLSQRELEVLQHIALGRTNHEIARQLIRTRWHRRQVVVLA